VSSGGTNRMATMERKDRDRPNWKLHHLKNWRSDEKKIAKLEHGNRHDRRAAAKLRKGAKARKWNINSTE